jgi:Transposase DDE domain
MATSRRSRQPTDFHPSGSCGTPAPRRLERTVRFDSHGKELVRSIAELELGKSYGPTTSTRLLAATLDPQLLKPESTWYLATSLPLREVSAEQVDGIYRLRDWIEHFYKPVKHELGWADYQMRPEQAIVRHWQLVLLAYTFSLLVGALPEGAIIPRIAPRMAPTAADAPASGSAGGKIRASRSPRRVEPDAAQSAGVALPVGSAAALLETLVERRPTARAGRAPRPRRALPPT